MGQKQRIPLILDATPDSADIDSKVLNAMVEFDKSADVPAVVACVNKIVVVPEPELRGNTQQQLSAEEMGELE